MKSVATHLLGVILAWFGGTTWTRYNYAEDHARQQAETARREAEDREAIEKMRGQLLQVPWDELAKMPQRMAKLETALEDGPLPRRKH